MAAESELHFGPFQLHEQTGQLSRDGLPMHMQPKPLALLSHLIRNRHRFVPKEELLEVVWPGVSVSNFALFSALRDLRRVLGDTDSAERMIRTARGRGIRFAARVSVVSVGSACVREMGSHAPGTRDDDASEPLSALLGSLAKARRGEVRVSFVSGAAGTGKTHLASELMRRASAEGVEAHRVRGIESAVLPCLPWRELARSLAAAGTADAVVEPRWESCRAWEGLSRLFARLSARRPLLLVIDDVHLTDDASLALLEDVLLALDRDPIHLVMTFRDPPRPSRALARVLATAARLACTERIELHGLCRNAVARMLAQATGIEPASSAVERIVSATSGNALFVSELVELASRGQLDLAALPSKLPVPHRVRDVLRGQLDRLSPEAQRVLHALSAAEVSVPLAALARVLGESDEAVLDALSEAEAAGIAIAADPAAGLAIEHELVRESIYRDLTATARARLHHRIFHAREGMSSNARAVDPRSAAYSQNWLFRVAREIPTTSQVGNEASRVGLPHPSPVGSR